MSDPIIPEVLDAKAMQAYENPIAQRRVVEEKLAGYGWGPSKIGRHLFHLQRHLIPCETEEQAIDLVRKDLKVIFSDIVDAEQAQRAGRMAEQVLRKRLMEQYENAWENSQDPTLSEPYRASQAKLALEITLKLAKLDKIDLDTAVKAPKDGGRFKVIVGEGGVARSVDEDDAPGSETN